MWKIKKLQVEKLWGEKNYSIDFYSDLNILIGSNGIGKTTILRILNSAINADTEYLHNLKFSQIKISFNNDIGQQKTLRVEKKAQELRFYISGKNIITESDKINDGIIFSEKELRERYILDNKRKKIIADLETPLVKWLPASRVTTDENSNFNFERLNSIRHNNIWKKSEYSENMSSEPLDIKITSLMNEMNSKIINIGQLIQAEDVKFRNDLFDVNFESLKSAFSENLKFADTITHLGDSTHTKELVTKINDLRVSYKLERFDEELIESDELLRLHEVFREGKNITIKDVYKLSSISFWIKAIELYDIYQEKITSIKEMLSYFEDNFDKIFNGKFYIDTKSNVKLYKGNKDLKTKEKFSPYDLSSGEKQMLIFLFETSLYLRDECVYLTDEPEISLHLKWQKKYIETLVSANKNNQYFIATHSPDIVSKYKINLINLNRLDKE